MGLIKLAAYITSVDQLKTTKIQNLKHDLLSGAERMSSVVKDSAPVYHYINTGALSEASNFTYNINMTYKLKFFSFSRR